MANVYNYWDKGVDGMSEMIKYIYHHNVKMSVKYGFNYILITDSNVEEYITLPKRFHTLAPNFKSDIVRFTLLNNHGGIWLDSDVIIMKDMNLLYNKLIQSEKWMIIDEEYTNKIGCATLVVLKNNPATNDAVQHIENILDTKGELEWNDLGPHNINHIYKKYKNNIILNTDNIVKNACNFITWRNDPGIRKHKWYLNSEEEAIQKSNSLINNENCYYVITWTIYRINDIESDIVDFVFKDRRSVFTHVVENV
jgi:mannosyltransferase OCH1-like enzyme